MAHARAPRLILLAALIAASACTSSPPAPDRAVGPSSAPAPSPSPSPSPSLTGTPRPQAVRLRAPRHGSVLVRGAYPRSPSPCVDAERPRLLARYPGTLSIARSDDGTLSVTLTLPFERYLEGIAEVPASWPSAALQAQAVAARSYALATTGWSGEEGATLDTPICATTSCQVYRGIPVPFDPAHGRWIAAVRGTAGEVLLFDGRPAETVYFSTSNGHTYGNDAVFGSAPLPYLRPVVERDDGASSTSHWRVRIPFSDLGTFLDRAGLWRARRGIADVTLDGGTVTVSGDGHARRMSLDELRSAVNQWAPCLEPDRYPPPSWRGTALPVTIPSRWLSMTSGSDGVTFTGRGWGHGVGMVQWGAYGKAVKGWSGGDILAYYYGGLRPQPYPEPGLIHVRVASGLRSLRLVPSAPGARLNGRPLGTGPVVISGGDRLTVQSR